VSEPWVVTYRICYNGQTLVAEFYRGDAVECIRIVEQSATGSDDRYPTCNRWHAVTGPAREWDKILEDG
jgi:hypothetical protein